MDIHFNRLREKLSRQIDAFSLDYQGVIVACSSGIDSIALFHVLYEIIKSKKNFSLALCHINFCLRGEESEKDQQFVENIAKTFNVPCFSHLEKQEKHHKISNIQLWARETRYALFSAYAKKKWVIALGHNLDDVAENVLMRLARGSGPRSLAGMECWHAPYWRPLIETSRAQIAQWMTGNNLHHREDSTNATMKYSRNRVRNQILPSLEKLYPGAKKRIARCAWDIKDICDFVQKDLEPHINDEHHSILKKTLNSLPRAVAFEVLSNLIGRPKNSKETISHKILEVIQQQALKNSSFWVFHLPGEKSVEINDTHILIKNEKNRKKKPRSSQHKANMVRTKKTYFIAAKTSLEIFKKEQKELVIKNTDNKAKFISMFPASGKDNLCFRRQDKTWAYKELLKLWGNKFQKDLLWYVVKDPLAEHVNHGLIHKNVFFIAAQNGAPEIKSSLIKIMIGKST